MINTENPDRPRVSYCSACQAPILWLKNVNSGRAAPVDAEPVADGNIVVNGSLYSVVVRATTTEPGPFHKNHFATCPNARQFAK